MSLDNIYTPIGAWYRQCVQSTLNVGTTICTGYRWCLQATFDFGGATCEFYIIFFHATFDVGKVMYADFGRGWDLMSKIEWPFWPAQRRSEQTTSDVGWPLCANLRRCDVGMESSCRHIVVFRSREIRTFHARQLLRDVHNPWLMWEVHDQCHLEMCTGHD